MGKNTILFFPKFRIHIQTYPEEDTFNLAVETEEGGVTHQFIVYRGDIIVRKSGEKKTHNPLGFLEEEIYREKLF